MASNMFLIALFVVSVGVLYTFRNKGAPRRKLRLAPHVCTMIPWLGGGAQLGWNYPKYMLRFIREYGPNWRIRIAGQSFVFVADPKTLDAFFRNRSGGLILDEIQDLAPRQIGGVQSRGVAGGVIAETLIPIIVKGNADASLCRFIPDYNNELHQYLLRTHSMAVSNGPVSLKHLTSHSLFHCAQIAVFGNTFPVHIYEDYVCIDNSSHRLLHYIPVFSSSVSCSRERMCAAIKTFMDPWRGTEGIRDIDGVSPYANDILRALVQSDLSDDDQAALFLTYIWGSNTNVGRVLFWLFAHLLCDKAAYARLQTEIDNAVQNEFGGELESLLMAHPRVISGPRFELLDSALKESLRLHELPMSHRTAEVEVELPSGRGESLWVLPGDHVMANVTAVHWDGARFQDPQRFAVDRFVGNAKSHSLYSWGKGAHICPGRHMANYYMKMFAIMLLHHFDIIPASENAEGLTLPADNPRSSGTMLPQSDILVSLVKRSGARCADATT